MDLYNNPELYDSIHSSYKWDKNLLSTIAKEIGGPVLELGSGTGRLAEVIINLGLDYEGIDINEKLTSVAMKRFGEKANFHIGDMQNFNLKKEFKFIFVGFNSFLHNLTDQSAIKCLKCIFRHLSKNGVFYCRYSSQTLLFWSEKKIRYIQQLTTLCIEKVNVESLKKTSLITKQK